MIMTKASLVVMSHLSDAQEMISFMCGRSASEEINFVKFIILKCKGDLTREIDEEAMYTEFQAWMKTLHVTNAGD